VTLTGIWNQLAILGFPTVALALLTLTHGDATALQSIATIGLAVFVVVAGGFALALSSAGMARRVGDLAARVVNWALRIVRRGPVGWDGESLARFRGRAIGLLRRRWHVLTLATIAGQLTVFLVLLACLRALGVDAGEVTVIEAFAGWSLARVLGSIPITPGGLGLVELGLTTVLVGFGGNRAGVVAAVLVYRFLTIVPTLVLGAAAAATWRRHRRHVSLEPEGG
jgi:putative heme transporter